MYRGLGWKESSTRVVHVQHTKTSWFGYNPVGVCWWGRLNFDCTFYEWKPVQTVSQSGSTMQLERQYSAHQCARGLWKACGGRREFEVRRCSLHDCESFCIDPRRERTCFVVFRLLFFDLFYILIGTIVVSGT